MVGSDQDGDDGDHCNECGGAKMMLVTMTKKRTRMLGRRLLALLAVVMNAVHSFDVTTINRQIERPVPVVVKSPRRVN